jgi:hypothetical protein
MIVVTPRSSTSTLDTGNSSLATSNSDSKLKPSRTGSASAATQFQALDRQQIKERSFTLQLNQQLSSMQSAQRYLSQLADQLASLKQSVGRSLSAVPLSREVPGQSHQPMLERINDLLDKRSQLSDGTLDASFQLRLDEPLRSRFQLTGLESLPSIQQSGMETLVFNAGRHLAAPVAVVLDNNMTETQILRRFNNSLGQTGLLAEKDIDGQLKFSAPEQHWQKLRGQLTVQGEGKLFSKAQPTVMQSTIERLFIEPLKLVGSSREELHRLLDSVDQGLDRIRLVADQLHQRQRDVREFLRSQESPSEKVWAHDYAASAFDSSETQGRSYTRVAQTVLLQANVTRFAVVGLLS